MDHSSITYRKALQDDIPDILRSLMMLRVFSVQAVLISGRMDSRVKKRFWMTFHPPGLSYDR
jgi:hypothetical protein